MITETSIESRTIVYRTRGSAHGPITRLISPGDLGEFLKPFVFLDLVRSTASASQKFDMHPHSGIATLTFLREGDVNYEDTTDRKSVV